MTFGLRHILDTLTSWKFSYLGSFCNSGVSSSGTSTESSCEFEASPRTHSLDSLVTTLEQVQDVCQRMTGRARALSGVVPFALRRTAYTPFRRHDDEASFRNSCAVCFFGTSTSTSCWIQTGRCEDRSCSCGSSILFPNRAASRRLRRTPSYDLGQFFSSGRTPGSQLST